MVTNENEIAPENFARAVEAAHRIRQAQPQATRFYWADRAVREVFGERLGILDDTVPLPSMPLYYSLVARVEAALWRERDRTDGGEP